MASIDRRSILVFAALALMGGLRAGGPVRAAAAEAPAASTPIGAAGRRKGGSGLLGHGFVAANGTFTTIDARGAGAFTVVFGIDEAGKAVGGYVDRKGVHPSQSLNRRRDQRLEDPPGQVESAQNCVDPLHTGHGRRVPQHVDDPSVTTARQHHQPLLPHIEHDRLVVVDQWIRLPPAIHFCVVARETLLEFGRPNDLPGDES
jgi:hypothetical protein